MPREFSRQDRVADFVKRELAILLQQELRDPRAASANVNDVVITRDLSIAKIYVTFMGRDDSEVTEAVSVLNNAAGFLRSQLASRHTMRSTPKLKFYFDDSVRTGAHLSSLIDKAISTHGDDNDTSAEDTE